MAAPAKKFVLRFQLGEIPLYVWGCYVLSFPLYVFQAGGLQPSAIILALTMFALLVTHQRSGFERFLVPATALLLFVSQIAIVDFIYFMQYGDPKFLKSVLFYVYNFLVFLSALAVYDRYRERFFTITTWCGLLSMILCIGLSPLAADRTHGGTAGYQRAVFFFQNPNEFGYFCVLLGMMVLYSVRSGRMRRLWAYLLIPALTGVCLFSVSRASLAAMVVIAALTYSWRVMLMGSVVVLAVGLYYSDKIIVLERLQQRIELVDTQNNEDVRQITRLFDNPDYLVFGAGEGATFERFSQHHEIHSMFPNILFSYGIIGFFLFTSFMLTLLSRMDAIPIIYLGPFLVYNVAHNGIRFSLAWVVLAFAFCLSEVWDDERLTVDGVMRILRIRRGPAVAPA